MAGFSFKLTRNDISPKLSKMVKVARNPVRVLRAMGTTFMSITMGNFNDVGAEYRPKPWSNKKDGTPSKLQKYGTLAKSFHLEVTDQRATVSNPTPYAATHQFGRTEGRGSPIPARPFFPVLDNKLTPRAEEKIAAAGQRMMESETGAE
jgi:phage gpG-like protein